MAPGAWLGAGRGVPSRDALSGRAAGAKSRLRVGSAWPGSCRIRARGRRRCGEDRGALRVEDGGTAELGYPRVQRQIELGLRTEPPAIRCLSRGRCRRPPWEKPMGVTEKGPSLEATPATKKRKLGTVVGEVGVSDGFAVELMGTCAAPGGRMSSLELRESSARMLEVTGGRWPKNLPIPWAEGEDMSTSRMARGLRIFPYGRNIAAVVSTVMNKDHQDAAQKRRAVVRIADPRREAKRARGSTKAAAPGRSQPMPAAKPAAPGSSRVSASGKTVASSGTKPPPGGSAKGRELPSPGRRVGDFGTDISFEDYLVGKFFLTGDLSQGRVKSSWLLSRLRRQPRCQLWWLGGRVPRKTRGPLSTRAARFRQPLPPRTWRAPCPSG
jgi:hypothetical protein